MYELIDKKKNNIKLTKEDIYYIVNGYANDEIPDYQMSAFLMAVCFNGMNEEETYNFTMAMKESGEELDLSNVKGAVVDKHSTGGVGDKVSLVVGPMVAACGVPVAKMSGRGLGYTGGTIDKLESFEGFNTSPTIEEFINNVNEIGISWAGQTVNLAPADKKIYALRDVTATVDSMPLIASSIMSKKLASGASGIVLDVTYGSGAFMETKESAEELARIMIKIGKMQGKKMSAVITNMTEPLGCAVGNSLEVIEAIEVLNGNGPKSVLEVSLAIGSHMLLLNGKCSTLNEARQILEKTIEEKTAISKMAEWVEKQGGNKEQVYDTSIFPSASILKEIIFDNNEKQYVSKINGKMIGIALMKLGGGRENKNSVIDLSVGIKLLKKVGDVVEKGDVYATIYGNSKEQVKEAYDIIIKAYSFNPNKINVEKSVFLEI